MRTSLVPCAAALLVGLTYAISGAWADDLPTRKPGLWEVTTHLAVGNAPAQTMKFCTDAATDAALYKFGMNAAQGMCSRYDLHHNGNTATVDTDCKMGDMKMTSHSVMRTTSHALPTRKWKRSTIACCWPRNVARQTAFAA